MAHFPKRPPQPELIDDYDDGDPYACMAAGAAERDLLKEWENRVRHCYGQPQSQLGGVVKASSKEIVGVCLYDIWELARRSGDLALRDWAAEQMAWLGDPSLREFDQKG